MSDIDLSYLNDVGKDGPEIEESQTETEDLDLDPELEVEEPEIEVDEPENDEDPAGIVKTGTVEVIRNTRKENRVQKLANERNAEREARIRAEAERDALLKYRSATPAPDNSEALRLRNERLSLMEPTERAVFLQNEQLEQMRQQIQLAELRSADMADKAAYDAHAMVDPRYARNKAAVEEKLRDFRAKGINATREQCLVYVIGEKSLSEKPRKDARESAAARVNAVKGKPTTAKGNSAVSAGKGNDLASLEARLRGRTFSSMFGD